MRPALDERAVDVWLLPGSPYDGEPELARLLGSYADPPRAVLRQWDEHGRPVIPGRPELFASISHTRGMTIVGVGRAVRVGVDIEAVRDRGLACLPEHALTAREQQDIAGFADDRPTEAFLSYWTRKEALLKAVGVGLLVEPSLIELPPPGASARVLTVPGGLGEAANWSLTEFRIPGFAASAAVETPAPAIRIMEAVRCGWSLGVHPHRTWRS